MFTGITLIIKMALDSRKLSQLSEDARKTATQKLMTLNFAGVGFATLGLMMVVIGLIFGS